MSRRGISIQEAKQKYRHKYGGDELVPKWRAVGINIEEDKYRVIYEIIDMQEMMRYLL